jgi:glutamate N-acetyltransferase/amino-acid N-acetyltransferase
MSIKPLVCAGPTTVPGFTFSGLHAGIKKKPDAFDLALIRVTTAKPAALAALFTVNRVKAPPVILSQKRLRGGRCRAVIVNSGNANACTGLRGMKDAMRMGAEVAKLLGCPEKEIQVGSTGVIGQHLPIEKLSAAIPRLVAEADDNRLNYAAQAIRTTDTYEKFAGAICAIDGRIATVCGIAKGSGMIAPDMATMLSYLVTDAAVPPRLLQKILREAAATTFNAITVDGEMSTNDSVLLLANGAAGNRPIVEGTKGYRALLEAVTEVCDFLARQIVRDGEGATKFVELRVSGLANRKHLKTIALAIANSPLVKTAFHGADANWGRILSAAGSAAARLGLAANFDRASIAINDVPVLVKGAVQGAEAENRAQALMRGESFLVTVNLGAKKTSEKLYTTDFSAEYVAINASYRS